MSFPHFLLVNLAPAWGNFFVTCLSKFPILLPVSTKSAEMVRNLQNAKTHGTIYFSLCAGTQKKREYAKRYIERVSRNEINPQINQIKNKIRDRILEKIDAYILDLISLIHTNLLCNLLCSY